MLCAACTQELSQTPVYKAVIETPTKTELSAGSSSYSVNWVSGDQVTVTDGSATAVYQASSVSGSSAELTWYSGGTPSGAVTAYYPASLSDMTLPDTQSYTEDNIAEAPMVGSSDDGETISFKNICSILKFNVTNSEGDVTITSLAFSADKGLSGEFTLSDDAAVVSGSDGLTLDCGSGVTIGSSAVAFYVAVPPGTYSSFSITASSSDGDTQTLSSSSSFTAERSAVHEGSLAFSLEEASEEQISLSWSSASSYYYITGIEYCDNPADSDYETMGIYVPTAYLTKNSDGSFSINESGTCNGYTASTAPIVIPVNTSGYSAQKPPTGSSSKVSSYISAGFIYFWPGCRGRDHGAPTGCTDLKAAIRYYRYLSAAGAVPGDTDCMFTFGHSGGGAQSAIMGASGNSSRYDDYLELIGANTKYSDEILGSMCWCPITNLDFADQAYEWNMGLTRSSLGTADAGISVGLAAQFATYINAMGFKDPDSGESLTLSATDDGYYQSGSYYEYIISVINDAVESYNSENSASVSTYDESSSSALYNFCASYKKYSKGLGAFDDYDGKSQAENTLFGISGTAGHFDANLATLVSTYASSYYSSFTSDLSDSNVDDAGKTVAERLLTYTPLYYLVDNDEYYPSGGPGSSDVAKYWRIRSGIEQGDTALCTEANLALALQNYSGVKSVDFATVWDQGHTQAEVSGSASSNFISWVQDCVSDYRGD